jgi:hypothetical protein
VSVSNQGRNFTAVGYIICWHVQYERLCLLVTSEMVLNRSSLIYWDLSEHFYLKFLIPKFYKK